MANSLSVRIQAWDTADGGSVPLHARLTVLPGLAGDERALLAGGLATLAGEPPAALVLRAADLPGAIVPPGALALDEALARARGRQHEDSVLAMAADAADAAVRDAQDTVADARARLVALAGRKDQATAALADANRLTERVRADRDALAAEPVAIRRPTESELSAATALVEEWRARSASVAEFRAEAPADLVEELEAAHAAVDEAERRGGVFGRRKLPQLRAREAAAAAAMEVPSYEAWLVRSSGLLPARDDARIDEVRRELAAAEAALAALTSHAEDHEATGRRAALARHQASAAEAEARANGAATALAAVNADREAAELALVAAERELADAYADRDAIVTVRATRAEPADDDGEVDLTKVDAAELELSLLSLMVAHESVGRPLVVDDAFAGLDPDRRDAALDVIAWASEAVQVVYLESGRTVAARAATLGPDLASVVDLHPSRHESGQITP